MHITQTHIASSEAQPEATTTILDVHGTLDGTGIQTLLESVQANMEKGSRRMIINLAEVDSVSSAGLVGLFMVGELLEGRPVQHLAGWNVIGQMRMTLEHGGTFPNLSLASANQNVTQALHASSFNRLVRTLPTVDDAIAAFPAL
jgi:anti-anti-sigma regulatory factor